MKILLSALISVICSSGTVPNQKDCVNYFNKCVKEAMASEDYKEYTEEFKKAHAIYYCGLRGGYLK